MLRNHSRIRATLLLAFALSSACPSIVTSTTCSDGTATYTYTIRDEFVGESIDSKWYWINEPTPGAPSAAKWFRSSNVNTYGTTEEKYEGTILPILVARLSHPPALGEDLEITANNNSNWNLIGNALLQNQDLTNFKVEAKFNDAAAGSANDGGYSSQNTGRFTGVIVYKDDNNWARIAISSDYGRIKVQTNIAGTRSSWNGAGYIFPNNYYSFPRRLFVERSGSTLTFWHDGDISNKKCWDLTWLDNSALVRVGIFAMQTTASDPQLNHALVDYFELSANVVDAVDISFDAPGVNAAAVKKELNGVAISYQRPYNPGIAFCGAGGGGIIRDDGAGDYEFDPWAVEKMKEALFSSLRFGGIEANTYYWRFGLGKNSERPLYVPDGGNYFSPNAFGLGEFSWLADQLNAEKVMVAPWTAYADHQFKNNNLYYDYNNKISLRDDIPLGVKRTASDYNNIENLLEFANGAVPSSGTSSWQKTTWALPYDTTQAPVWSSGHGTYSIGDKVTKSVEGIDFVFKCFLSHQSGSGIIPGDSNTAWRDYWQCLPYVEVANGTTSWAITADNAPSGYFAWLREKLASENNQPTAAYNIKRWEIGNETESLFDDTVAARGDFYALGLNAFHDAIKAIDSTNQVGAVASLPTLWAGYINWPNFLTKVLDQSEDNFDFYIPHLYTNHVAVPTGTQKYNNLFTDASGAADLFREYAKYTSKPAYITEFNDGATDGSTTYHQHSMKAAIGIAMKKFEFAKANALGANLYQAVNVNSHRAENSSSAASIYRLIVRDEIDSGPRQWVTPTYYVQQMFGRFAIGKASPGYDSESWYVSAQAFEDGNVRRIFLVNKSESADIPVKVDLNLSSGSVCRKTVLKVDESTLAPGTNLMEASNETQDGSGNMIEQIKAPTTSVVSITSGRYIETDLDAASITVLEVFLTNATGIKGIVSGNSVPVRSAIVVLKNGSGTEIARTITDSDGFYTFSELTAGTYSVSVSKRGYQDVVTNNVVVSTNALTTNDISTCNAVDYNVARNGDFSDISLPVTGAISGSTIGRRWKPYRHCDYALSEVEYSVASGEQKITPKNGSINTWVGISQTVAGLTPGSYVRLKFKTKTVSDGAFDLKLRAFIDGNGGMINCGYVPSGAVTWYQNWGTSGNWLSVDMTTPAQVGTLGRVSIHLYAEDNYSGTNHPSVYFDDVVLEVDNTP